VTVLGEYMPGDYSIHYASPWAGANYLPVSRTSTPAAEWDRNTWPELEKLAKNSPEAGIWFQDNYILNRDKDAKGPIGDWMAELRRADGPWFKDVLPNYRRLKSEELPSSEYDNGITFTTVCINTAIYLPWLASQCLKAGVIFKRSVLKHICDAADQHHSGTKAHVVVNCVGLAAYTLAGVEDKKMTPGRAQVVLVRNSPGKMFSTSGTDDGDDELLYIMERAAGGGTIIGGCYQKGNWDGEVDPNLATRMMKRAVDVCPALTGGKGIEHLSVIRHSVGLRPIREGGVRLEKEKINGVWVCHNYGHGGAGYQSSYGCSQVAVGLIEEILSTQDSSVP